MAEEILSHLRCRCSHDQFEILFALGISKQRATSLYHLLFRSRPSHIPYAQHLHVHQCAVVRAFAIMTWIHPNVSAAMKMTLHRDASGLVLNMS